MALCQLHYFSPALGKQTAAMVVLPESPDVKPPYATFYLLHGLSDDHTIWLRRTSIERYVEGLPLIVVMPDGGRGFYCDAVDGFAYDAAIAADLVGLIDRTFPTRADRSGRCVGGLSMGGYGAMRFALAHPDIFGSATSHSGALRFGHDPIGGDHPYAAEFARILGPTPAGGPNDLFALAAGIPKSDLPALRIDCGTEDFLIEDNRAFHAYLDQIGVPHEYAEFSGDHNWGYWDQHVQEALAFHLRVLGIER